MFHILSWRSVTKPPFLHINAWSILNLLPHAQLMGSWLIFHPHLILIRSRRLVLLLTILKLQFLDLSHFSPIFSLFISLLMSYSKIWCLSFCFHFILFLSCSNLFTLKVYVLVSSIMFFCSSTVELGELSNSYSAVNVNIGIPRPPSFLCSDSSFLSFSEIIPPVIAVINSVWKILSTSSKNFEMFGIVLMT